VHLFTEAGAVSKGRSVTVHCAYAGRFHRRA